MKKTGIPALFFCMLAGCGAPSGEDRVQQAFDEKMDGVKAMFREQGIAFDASWQVFFRAFKSEKILELWVSPAVGQPFLCFKKYEVCNASGAIGPKRKEGDRQVPEGFYRINRFNPESKFHLSLGLDYPNGADLILADGEQPGSDIFIHGGCKSIGCLAMTDDAIKEIYLIASEAKKRGQASIEVHIFPTKMTAERVGDLCAVHPQLASFWRNLKTGYYFFEKTKLLPRVDIDANGSYRFSP